MNMQRKAAAGILTLVTLFATATALAESEGQQSAKKRNQLESVDENPVNTGSAIKTSQVGKRKQLQSKIMAANTVTSWSALGVQGNGTPGKRKSRRFN